MSYDWLLATFIKGNAQLAIPLDNYLAFFDPMGKLFEPLPSPGPPAKRPRTDDPGSELAHAMLWDVSRGVPW